MSIPSPIDRSPRRGGKPRALKILALIIACGVPGYYLEERVRGHAAWHRYEIEAKERGVKLELADYVPPKIPDAENFASIPIFEAAFRAADQGGEVPNPCKLPARTKGDLPSLSDPTKQTRVDLAAWQAYFVETKLLPVADENAATGVLKALEHFAAPLGQLRDAGSRPHCRFPVHWEKGFEATLPQYTLVQSALKLYALRIEAHLALGESAAAYEDFHEGLRVPTSMTREPGSLAGWVRISNISTLENAVWSGLAGHQWTEPELRKIEGDLAAVDLLHDYLLALGSERGCQNLLLDTLIHDPQMLAELARLTGFADDSKKSDRGVFWFYPTGWLYQSKTRTNRFCDELSARIDPSQRRWLSEHTLPSSATHITSIFGKLRYALLLMADPVLENSEKRYLQTASFTDEARLACALERFRLARGNFPDELAELAPEFISRVPVEIVNGQPYHYRRTEDASFVLYSVGTDLHDDGGVIDPKLSNSRQRDWVWRYPAK